MNWFQADIFPMSSTSPPAVSPEKPQQSKSEEVIFHQTKVQCEQCQTKSMMVELVSTCTSNLPDFTSTVYNILFLEQGDEPQQKSVK